MLVERSIYEQFKERFVAAAKAVKVGDPKDPATVNGPLVSAAHAEKVNPKP